MTTCAAAGCILVGRAPGLAGRDKRSIANLAVLSPVIATLAIITFYTAGILCKKGPRLVAVCALGASLGDC
ncbi:hypothetical protein GCG54_00014715 [Colletotrichum gloeosporioides]|uniref:Uncharacterized protein n=1 Tax=Colletotrichum gloeosporioides TaxID=474922 RepID=A0A8H4FGZ1_COLGL|nr:uncharacterized protein GCG54_00014715 [Colletotrichum gloeosporioides]KAF3801501.1 hypothetical protein GCG54_00014715 [Colletotrichum gloeosporioides]